MKFVNRLLNTLLVEILYVNICKSASVIDLTYTYDKSTPNHPKLSKFDLRIVKRGPNKYGTWVELNDFFSSEHSGTHMDAPVHFYKGGKTVDEIPLENLYRVPGIKIDLRHKVRGSKDYEITSEDIEEWIKMYGTIPDGAVVLFQTGWGSKAKNQAQYSGMDQYGKLHFPGLGVEAAQWIAKYKTMTYQKKGIIGVGLDTISLDVGQASRYKAHITLLSKGIFGLENVANLNNLPAKGFTLSIFPMKIGQGSGAPTRIISELEGDPYSQLYMSSTDKNFVSNILILLSLNSLLIYVLKI